MDNELTANTEKTEITNRDENTQLRAFANADIDHLACKVKPSKLKMIWMVCRIPFKCALYLCFLPLWPHRITLAEARGIRNVLFAHSKHPWWQRGFISYYFFNFVLWHLHKHVRELDLDAEDGKHTWHVLCSIWERIESSDGRMFSLYNELRARTYDEFLSRDKSYFNSCNGDCFFDKAGDILGYLMFLDARGNKVARILFSWVSGLVQHKHITIPASRYSAIFTEDANKWLERIRFIRREIVERLVAYIRNMMTLCQERNDSEGVVKWNEAICKLQLVASTLPDRKNHGKIAALTREFCELFNEAGRYTYAKGWKPTPIAMSIEVPKGKRKKIEEKPQSTTYYGRIKVETYITKCVITDTVLKKKPYKFTTGSHAYEFALRLVVNHGTAQDQTICPDYKWKGAFQSGRGDAARFARDQIFMLPRWDPDKRKYIPKQYAGKWRLWTDDELKMSKDERVEAFKEAHPQGHGSR